MRIVKYTHACVRLEKGDSVLVIDPGIWAEPEALEGASAVLITHEHFDHVDVDAVRAAAARDPKLRVYTHAGLADQLALGEQFTTVAPGEGFTAAGFDIQVHGGQHALIHPDIPVVSNVAYLVDQTVYHPGDSLTNPAVPVETLLVPTSAPWLRLADAIDFVRAVRPTRAFSIHDALLSDNGAMVVDNNLRRLTEPYGVEYRRLQPAEAVEL